MKEWLLAVWYRLRHSKPVQLTVIRRYKDANEHFIGELYLGKTMIGMSCDNLPMDMESTVALSMPITLCYSYDFTEPLPVNTLRIGGMTPDETKATRLLLGRMRYCAKQMTFQNRFIEHVLAKSYRTGQ